ncbi:hypothetical protein QCB07_004413 [Salmonella enterica]|nr:hypothetical protein [Salmonella enterica]
MRALTETAENEIFAVSDADRGDATVARAVAKGTAGAVSIPHNRAIHI